MNDCLKYQCDCISLSYTPGVIGHQFSETYWASTSHSRELITVEELGSFRVLGGFFVLAKTQVAKNHTRTSMQFHWKISMHMNFVSMSRITFGMESTTQDSDRFLLDPTTVNKNEHK